MAGESARLVVLLGHAATATLVFTALALVMTMLSRRGIFRVLIWLRVAVAVVAFSRVLRGALDNRRSRQHCLCDGLAGSHCGTTDL